MPPPKNFRKRSFDPDTNDSDDEEQHRIALEEVKFLQKQRERKTGIPALPAVSGASSGSTSAAAAAAAGESWGLQRRSGGKVGDGLDGSGDKEDQVLQDTFAQETAVTIEDPNMLNYVEQELAKKKGKKMDSIEKEKKDQIDELYVVPDHLKVKKRNSEESSTQWTTGIAEVQLPIEYKLKNIEETEAAKKQLQEKRLSSSTKTKKESNIPSSFSADYFHRGRDYAEKLRREHPELYKDRGPQVNETKGEQTELNNNNNNNNDNDKSNSNNKKIEGRKGERREAATDEFMLNRFRKREKYRVMRR